MVNKASEFFEAEITYETIKMFIIAHELEDKIGINFQILIDQNIYDNNQFFMLWINWTNTINIVGNKVDLLHSLRLSNNEDVVELDHIDSHWQYSQLSFGKIWPDIGCVTFPTMKRRNSYSKFKMRYNSNKTKKCQHKMMKYTKKSTRFMYHRW